MTGELLTVRGVRARPVLVPLARAHESAGGSVGSAPLVLIDLLTEEGVDGASYLCGFAPYALGPMAELANKMGALLAGKAVTPLEIGRTLRASFRFIGPQGLIGLVMAGIDMAAWDVLAKSAGMPLARLLGGTIRPLPAYAGLGKSENLEEDAQALAAAGPAGHARIAREVRTPIQLGEKWSSPREMARSLQADASDYVMVDVMKIGGVSGWMRAAALADVAGLPLSSHIAPEYSAHLLAATPTAHWVESHEWTRPIVQEPVVVQDGFVTPSSSPGAGLAWDEAAVERCLVG